jgi:coenzyme F420-reducing hydrogenase beta subunit
MDEDGKYQAVELSQEHSDIASRVCPFANGEYNEDVLGKEIFGSVSGIQHDDVLGFYLKTYIGHAVSGGFRDKGSSGGLVNWMASRLLATDKVDAVIHVKESSDGNVMYSYQVSRSVQEIQNGAKSKYYPIELSEVLDYVKNHDERFVVIGIPCFIKALRLLEKEDESIRNRIKYHIGLVCGHLKSSFFALAEAWESGIDPEHVKNVDFRYKLPGRSANDYAIKATGISNGKPIEVVKPTRELSTTNWGYGYFKYNACEYCDDVLAETADVTCGDAWLPGYQSDGKGTNVVVVRNSDILDLLEKFSSETQLEEVPSELVVQSQSSGVRHRREGLSYRLHLKDEAGEWRPTKRVSATDNIPRNRKRVYEGRIQLMNESFTAFHGAQESGEGMSFFVRHMGPIVKAYKKADNPLWRRIARKVKRILSGTR